jgi:hypothetical protein
MRLRKFCSSTIIEGVTEIARYDMARVGLESNISLATDNTVAHNVIVDVGLRASLKIVEHHSVILIYSRNLTNGLRIL